MVCAAQVPEGSETLNVPILMNHYYNQPAAYVYWIFLVLLDTFFIVVMEPRYARKVIFVWLLLCATIRRVWPSSTPLRPTPPAPTVLHPACPPV